MGADFNPIEYWNVWYDVATQCTASTINDLKNEMSQIALQNGTFSC